MRRTLQILRTTLVTLVVSVFVVGVMQAKPEYTKKEGKNCATCHTKAGSKELNKVGKCYEEKKSLKACLE